MNTLFAIDILNPLDPADCIRREVEFTPGATLAELFPVVAVALPRVLSINGKIVPEDQLALTFPSAGDYVTLCPVPTGGSGGKSVLRMVAILAVSMYAPTLAGQLAFQLGGGLILGSAGGLMALQVGITVAGAMVVNSLLPPPKPTAATKNDTSPTYGIDGAKNTSAEGIPVPLCYGRFRTAGNFIQNYVVNTGDGTQILYMLINAGEGPIASISEVEIDGQPITNYTDYELVTDHLGESNQSIIGWFKDGTTSATHVNQILTDAWKVVATGVAVDRLRLDFSAPGGLFTVDDKGSLGTVEVPILVQSRRRIGSDVWTDWTDLPLANDIAEYTLAIKYNTVESMEWSTNGDAADQNIVLRPAGPIEGQFFEESTGLMWNNADKGHVIGSGIQTPIYSAIGAVSLKDSTRSTVRKSVITPALTEGYYEVRYKRNSVDSAAITVSDDVYLSDMDEIITDPIAYNNTALLGVKIKLGGQLSNIPTVTYMNGGKLIRVYKESTGTFETEASDNPAWIVYDILTNVRYGGGAALSRIPLDNWRDWANWNSENKLTFRGVFDKASNIWDASNNVARCGRAQLIRKGTKFDVVIERAEPPTMMFSVANMIDGTFKETWLSTSDRANEVEVSFADSLDGYKQRTVRIYDHAALAAGTAPKTAAVTLQGVDTSQRAYDEAQLMLNLNKYVLRTVEFGAPIEAISCVVGNVILVQHDMPQWGYAGRLEAGSSTSSVSLDRTVTMTAGKTYQVLVHYPALRHYLGTVKSIAGDNVILNGYDGTNRPQMRLKISGQDLQVYDTVASGSDFGVTLESTFGISSGTLCELWEVNALVTRDVVNPQPSGSSDYLNVRTATALPEAPGQFEKWLFGESLKVAKPFRVKKISGSHDYRRDITAIEYNEQIYDGATTVPALDYSDLMNRVVNPVTVFGISEVMFQTPGGWLPKVTIAYSSSQTIYATSEVQVQRNGSFVWESIGTHPERLSVLSFVGETLNFRVISRDKTGRTCPVGLCPTQLYTTLGKIAASDPVYGLIAVLGVNGDYIVSWNANTAFDYLETEIHLEGTWNNSTAPLFRGKANSFIWKAPDASIYTLLGKHRDTSGNVSTNAVSITVNVVTYVPSVDWTAVTGNEGVISSIADLTTSIGAITSDNILASSEKGQLVRDYDYVYSGYSEIRAQALSFGSVTDTERLAWGNALVNLKNYLDSPALVGWNVIPGEDIVIDGAQMRGYFLAINQAKAALERKMLTLTKGLADGAKEASDSAVATMVNVATISMYQWGSAAQPGAPASDTTSTYTWSTGVNNGYSGAGDGWSLTMPANPGTPGIHLWAVQKRITAASGVASSTVTWDAGVTFADVSVNGSAGGGAGPAGSRFANVSLFQWAATIPTILGSNTYTWASSSLSGALPTDWTLTGGNSPSPGFTLWRASINLFDAATTAESSVDWTSSAILAAGYAGTAGPVGNSIYTGTIYQRVTAMPATPSGGSFNFATSALTTPANWSASQPASASTTPTWACDYTFSTATAGATVTAGTWGTPYVDAVSGAEGSSGADGQSILVFEVYLLAASASAPSGGSYNFSTDAFVAPAGGWSRNMPASTSTPTLRSTFRFVTTTPATVVSASSWTTPVVVAQQGAKGDTGSSGTGTAGAAGASARIAYTRTSFTSLGSGNVITSGNASFPPSSSWGGIAAWSASVPTGLTAGESVYQTNGIYDGSFQTVWGTPYLSNLKVGSLSAISANLGVVTAGSVNINDKFVVGSDGYLVAKGIRIEDENGNVILQTKNGSTSPVPASFVQPDAGWLNSSILIGGRNRYHAGLNIGSIQAAVSSITRSKTGFSVDGSNNNDGVARLYNIVDGNGTYTISFDLAVSLSPGFTMLLDFCDSVNTWSIVPTTVFQHFSHTFTVSNYTLSTYNFIDFNQLSGQRYTFTNFKVESGNVATDWTPAPEDIDAQLLNITSDNILSKGEKPGEYTRYLAISQTDYDLRMQANSYAVSTSNYMERFAELGTYLENLSPNSGWRNSSIDTVIVGSVYQATWQAATAAREALRIAIATAAGTRSTWDGVSGLDKPANSASSGGVLNTDPYCTDRSRWENGNTLITPATITDGAEGSSVFRQFQGQNAPILSNRVRIDKNKTYRVRGLLRAQGGSNGRYYLVAALFDVNGTAIQGGGSYWWYPAQGVLSTEWVEYTGIFGVGTNQLIPSNAVTGAIGVFLHYDGTAGGWNECQGMRFEEITEIFAIASDNVLSKGEKSGERIKWDTIEAEFVGVKNSGWAYGLNAYVTEYINRVDTLAAYLNAISGGWADVSVDSPIIAADYAYNWKEVYRAKQQLLDQIARVAGERSTWAGTSGTGKPRYFTVSSFGYQPTTNRLSVGLYEGSTHLLGDSYWWNFRVMDRFTGALGAEFHYHPGDSLARSDEIASYIASLGNSSIILVWTNDHPTGNMISRYLRDVLYTCGASRNVLENPAFLSAQRACYAFVGICKSGEGKGLEIMSAITSDAIELPWTLQDGQVSGGGGWTGFTGDLNANNTTNTNQLTDGAELGQNANYSKLAGTPAAGIANSSVYMTAGGALGGAGGGQIQSLPIIDNDRYTVQPPSFYAPGGAGYRISEFKSCAAFGLPTSWFTLETIGQFQQGSGAGYVVQYAYVGQTTYRRYSQDTGNAWGAWVLDLDRASYTGELDATRGATFGSNISGKITPATASIYIENQAVGTAQIANLAVGTAQIANLAVGQAQIANLSVGTLQIGDNAVTVPIGGPVGGVGGNTIGNTTSRTTSVNIGSIATSQFGQGRVIIWLAPRAASSDNAYRSTQVLGKIACSAVGSNITFRFRILRNVNGAVTEIYNRTSYDGSNSGTPTFLDAVTHAYDTPGSGVVAYYSYEIYSWSPYPTNMNHEIVASVVTLMECRK
jgi:predicted phage tail protein